MLVRRIRTVNEFTWKNGRFGSRYKSEKLKSRESTVVRAGVRTVEVMAGILQTSRVIGALAGNIVVHSHPFARLQMIVVVEAARVARTVLVVTRVRLVRSVRCIVVITAADLIHIVLIVRGVVVRLVGVLRFRLLIVVVFRQELSFRVRYLVTTEDTEKRKIGI